MLFTHVSNKTIGSLYFQFFLFMIHHHFTTYCHLTKIFIFYGHIFTKIPWATPLTLFSKGLSPVETDFSFWHRGITLVSTTFLFVYTFNSMSSYHIAIKIINKSIPVTHFLCFLCVTTGVVLIPFWIYIGFLIVFIAPHLTRFSGCPVLV